MEDVIHCESSRSVGFLADGEYPGMEAGATMNG